MKCFLSLNYYGVTKLQKKTTKATFLFVFLRSNGKNMAYCLWGVFDVKTRSFEVREVKKTLVLRMARCTQRYAGETL